jgi:hypothetical protein
MSEHVMEAFKVKLKQLDELVVKYRSELQRRGSLRSELDHQFDGRFTNLVIDHKTEMNELYDAFQDSITQSHSKHASAVAALQSDLALSAQTWHTTVNATANKTFRFCSISRSVLGKLSARLTKRCSQFDADTSVLFEKMQQIAINPKLPFAPQMPSRTAEIASLERQIAFLRKQRLELEHAFELDSLRTELQSLRLHNKFDLVRSTQCCVVELALCRSCLFQTDGLRKIASEANEALALFQRRRFDIAHDRINYERGWNSALWEELDAIQNLQLDVDLNLYFSFHAKLNRLDQVFGSESRASAESRGITKLKQNIAFLRIHVPRDRIAFQAEYQARQSEYVVQMQQLERAQAEELQKLYDQRDGLLGMYNERIEVLLKSANPPSSIRERHLETVLKELSGQLATLKRSLRSRIFYR